MTLRRGQRAYAANWAALVALAALSFVLSKRPVSSASMPIAMSIATAKALLIVFFFMHVARYKVSARLAAVAALGMITLLAGLMVADVMTRERAYGPTPHTPGAPLAASGPARR